MPDLELLELLRESSGLSLDRDARWLQGGEAITHKRILEVLDRGLEVREDGRVVVHVGPQWAYVEVADTPFVVRNIRALEPDDAGRPGAIELLLGSERSERLEPATLRLRGAHDLYCRVQQGLAEARFGRSAYHNLMPWLAEGAPGSFVLELAQGPVAIPQE